MGGASILRVLVVRMSPRTRGWLALSVAIGVAGRLLLVALASRVAEGVSAAPVALGVAIAVVFAALRAVQSFVRVAVLRDVYAMTVRAVLASDVVGVPTSDVRRVALDGSHHAVILAGELAPALLADVLTSAALVPFLLGVIPLRLVGLAALVLAVVMAVAFAARSLAYRLEQRVSDRYAEIFDALLGSIESRVEIVARAGEAEFAASFERGLSEYESLVRRLGFGASLLGRAPLAAAALAVLLVVGIDDDARSVFAGALSRQALVLAACVPPFHGALAGAHGMVRSLVLVRPLVDLLSASRDAEDGPARSARVELPAVVRGERVCFSYSAGAPPVLSDVSFVWSVSEPLVLVGRNGAGKSTLFKLLLGLRPVTSGVLRYGSHPLAALDLGALRRQMAYLPQRSFLGEAHVTVRAALRLAVPGASDEAMKVALERTGVLDALRESGADPLAVPVGELSAGQRQRVALARVLLQDAKLVLMDEPDANLDADGVALVAAIAKEMCAEGKMVAIAAHTRALAALSSSPLDLERPRRPVVLRSVGGG